MKQLTALDASFLYLETPNTPMHVGGLAIYDPSTAQGGSVRFKEILENTRVRALGIPTMTDSLVNVPLEIDHPYWITNGEFDAEFHIQHIALPSPGDWRQLAIQVSRLHSRSLDRSRPLWEMYVIEGLDNVESYPEGCFALYTKVHHAAIDGASGMEITAAIHDLEPDPAAVEEPSALKAESTNDIELMMRAHFNNLTKPFQFIELIQKSLPGVSKTMTGLATGGLKPITDIARTRFNKTPCSHRVFDAVKFDFEDIRTIKNSLPDITVNDVALTICGGTVRKYLEEKGELPDQSIVAMVPINVQAEEHKGSFGNQVSGMLVSLRTDIADPIQQLTEVNAGTKKSKELTNAIGAKNMSDYSLFVPANLAASAARLSS